MPHRNCSAYHSIRLKVSFARSPVVHGIYWRQMPHYAEQNALDADVPILRLHWTGKADMHCLAESIGHTIDHAYVHHVGRLMILGPFCLWLGVRTYQVHRWHMSMFRDVIDWVSAIRRHAGKLEAQATAQTFL